MLTVKELIQFLETLPEDYNVYYVKTYPDEFDEWETYDTREELWSCDIHKNDEQKIITIWEIRV